MKPAYYNENDLVAAAWLRELIAGGHIAPGDVDTRSISDVAPDDLRGYQQCHFFAGIGGWSLALRWAGWPDDRSVWTGSCPCQPFSAAGRAGGFADQRHLWPHFHWLIEQRQPPVVYGEQVASAAGLEWFDLVCADLEGSGYAVGGADLCAAGVGAPHIRQRLYWVANSNGWHTGPERQQPGGQYGQQPQDGCAGRLADGSGAGLEGRTLGGERLGPQRATSERGRAARGLGDAHSLGTGRDGRAGVDPQGGPTVRAISDRAGAPGATDRPHPVHGGWSSADWLHCRDGKWRPVEAGTFPLAHGVPARMGRLRGYGNAIVPQVAEAFIRATL